MSETYRVIAGLDIGNGYVKAKGKMGSGEIALDFPSSVAYVTNAHNIAETNPQVAIDNIMNVMDASFDSPLINQSNTRRLFGTRGLSSGMATEEFDVYSHLTKARQELSPILVLGTLAGMALKNYWAKRRALPKDNEILKVKALVSLALPITEYKKYRKEYAQGYMASSHMVMIHNFETPVRIQIEFFDVDVQAEGVAAAFAIKKNGVPLMDSLLADLRSKGYALTGITSQDILAATSTVGIDIGEGTTNFPVTQNKNFNADASLTFDTGYGSVLARALDRLQEEGMAFRSRKDLGTFIQAQPTALSRARYNKVAAIVEEEIEAFSNDVAMQFVKILSRTGSFAEVIYVYGGGAEPMRQKLYPALLKAMTSFGGVEAGYPILYLDSNYSRFLNRSGLYEMAKMLAGGRSFRV